ncbi:IPTL-CTERM sorting domain-containing protein [Acidovorax sp. DW039]|uniref:IPTL-CTERM sorting domain-containing protein n=1 Tax=Acidovorax sp. DW039 TaxID=3095606 RepID=UPI0030886ACB|nr:IPTL-CTERM sorting domain-containing protein [Acidovorax sp. DW039]
MKFPKAILAVTLAIFGIQAHAVYSITAAQVGSNVVINGSGSIDTTGMTLIPTSSAVPCNGSGTGTLGDNSLCLGPLGPRIRVETILTPQFHQLTGGVHTDSDSATGDPLIINDERIYLPLGFISGVSFSNTTTFNNKTIAGLGLTPGSQTFTLTSGDTIVFTVVTPPATATATTSVPTLSEYTTAALAALMAFFAMATLRSRN